MKERRRSAHFIQAAIIAASLMGSQLGVFAGEKGSKEPVPNSEKRLLIVQEETPFLQVVRKRWIATDRIKVTTELRCPTEASLPSKYELDGHALVRVERTVDSRIVGGWVYWDRVVDMTAMRNRSLRLLGRVTRESAEPDAAKRLMPALIKLHSKEVQDIWKTLHVVLEQSTTTGVIPEVYFSRARLWSVVGNHHDALKDLGQASRLVRKQGADLARYAEYFVVIDEALAHHLRFPGQPVVTSALKYWEQGYYALVRREADVAVANFTDAIQLNPRHPMYWYSRAYTLKHMGLTEEAERDVRIGTTAERDLILIWRQGKATRAEGKWVRGGARDGGGALPGSMNGPVRIWLERFRRGDGVAWGWQKEIKEARQD